MQAQSLLQNSTPLNFLPKKHQIFLPIILLLNSIKITFPSFYYFSIIFQHIPLLIISIEFQINKTSSQKQLSKIIRYFSSYKLQEIISNANFYLIVNIIFILVELFYFLYFLKKHLELSKHNKSSFLKPKPKVHLLITILYYFNMLFISQLTEFLSLIIYHIIFKDKFILLLPKNLFIKSTAAISSTTTPTATMVRNTIFFCFGGFLFSICGLENIDEASISASLNSLKPLFFLKLF